jgi:hypothetical protein
MMKIDTQKLIAPDVKIHFETQNELPFFMHQYHFNLFAEAKKELKTLTFDDFLETQSLENKRYSFGIKRTHRWQVQLDEEVLVCIDDNQVKYSLIPLSLKELDTLKIYRMGDRHIVSPDNKVFSIQS